MERVVFSSSEDEDHSLDRMAAYFQARAKGGVGLMVTGGIAPNKAGWVGPFAAKLSTEKEMERHKVVTEAVHSVDIPIFGSEYTLKPKICMQILHTGRYAYHPFAVSASNTKSPISPFPARALSTAEIQQTVLDFTNTAILAAKAGYDGVEVMGSEGYLLSQFLSPRTNHRTDDYGGSFPNRARFPLEIVKSIRDAVDPSFIIIFRISLLDLVDGGMSWEETLELAAALEHAGVTILNTGIGWHEARVPTIATAVPRGTFGFCTKALKEANVVSIPLVSTNRINDPSTAESLLQNNVSDMVSMARPFLADPNFMKKAMEEESLRINTCIACNQACLDHAFVGKTASCLVNPFACHETELVSKLLPKADHLRIGVVGTSLAYFSLSIFFVTNCHIIVPLNLGAGPAGCSFSLAAAEVGHQVTLYDQSDRIGGQFNMAKRIPGKEEFHETLRYFDEQIRTSNRIEVELETTVDYETMLQNSNTIDKWVIATGVTPRDPKIPGQDHPNVLTYIDVLRENLQVGDRVGIIGAGGIGFDVAEFLLYHENDNTHRDISIQEFWNEWGIDQNQNHRGGLQKPMHKAPKRQIHLLQRGKGKVGAGLGRTTGWIHRATLKAGQVNMINGVTYDSIDQDGNLHYTLNGDPQVLEVDTIVLCAGQVEQRMLQEMAVAHQNDQEAIPSDFVYTIGGAHEAGELDAKRAIDMGTRLALRIHEKSVVQGKHIFQAAPTTEERLFQLLQKLTK
jgi:2,4-dienoyl-CoA reductase (NADPH2)